MAHSNQAGTPAPGGKRSTGFWIIVIGGCLGVCGVLLVAGIILVGVLAGISEDSGAPGATSNAGTTGGANTSIPRDSDGPDDFVYRSTSGLEFIAPNHVSAEGVNVTLAGVWREDQRSITLRLGDGGRYELSIGGGAILGTSKYDTVASNSAEKGAWTFEGSTLTLSPDGYDLSGVAEGKSNSGNGRAEAPRQWGVVGVTIEYTPNGADTARHRPGLRINGPSPSWYYPPGNVEWVFRSAR